VPIASHIGQYRIVRRIGAGGMGLVFLAEHTLLGRRAAIKTLLPSVSTNPEIVERFFNEARATSAISDPGVIQIYDFGYHVDGTAYIVMELLEGESLSARIARLGRLSPAHALRLARQIAGSLATAHARGIVHRDLKPDNVFLVGDGEAQGGERTKILDFGICKVGMDDPKLTQSGSIIGTPVYMSPEQCCGARDVDHRADIYAFGCLLFHMLTGRPPFVGDVTGELIVAHLEQDPPAPSRYVAELPTAIDALLLRCLAKAPGDRYPSMTELHRVLGDLHAAVAGSETAVARVRPAMPLGRGFRSVYDANVAALVDASHCGRASPNCGAVSPDRDAGARKVLMTPRMRPTPSETALSGLVPGPTAPTQLILPPVSPPPLSAASTALTQLISPPVPPPRLSPAPARTHLMRPPVLTQLIPTPVPPAPDPRDELSPRRRAGVFAVLGGVLVAGVVIGLLATSLVVSSQADPVRPLRAVHTMTGPATTATATEAEPSAAPGVLVPAATLAEDREPPPVRATESPIESPIKSPIESPRSPPHGLLHAPPSDLPRSHPRGSLDSPRAVRAPTAASPPSPSPSPAAAPTRSPTRSPTPANEDLYDAR
jgi:serine/threonine protein kinase